ncbi:glycosyl transferase family 64 domain-containing protein [Cokeromyces recurvatus]|uniref:glycosyl transferase family 64 domain-containing protein n=1 Tax=Cokeromyces recurvatus TaxID=90255 RepID=UPI00221F9301|nr:glycosyl transferase family 64 domain-containing protein [Cokeromyces recurvatus]KAI7907182.1 glycosyl transferase family 64 domain-containing protein [Cokeromyces recurvatus]
MQFAQQQDKSRDSSAFNLFKKKNALATMICDPNMLEATLISVYSLNTAFAKKPSSKKDVIVLIPETMKNEDIERLKELGTHVIKTSMLSFNDNMKYNSCNPAMLINLWALFDYQKVVYFTPEIIFDNNVDQLFNFPSGSSIVNKEEFYTPLFILEPNPITFESLVRDYKRLSSNTNSAQLFNQLLDQSFFDYSLRIPKDTLKQNVYVFDKKMKPWNFHTYHDFDWKKEYDPLGFYKWRHLSNSLRDLFNLSSDWKNKDRQRMVCDAYLDANSNNINHFTIQNQFSVMISTYNPERIEHLSLLIQHLLKSKKVHTVFVTWHNPNLEVPDTLYQGISEKDLDRVKVLMQSFDSLNNRFNPVNELKTDAVYIMDDDIYIDLDDLEFTFSIWQQRKDSVVGHFPRYHTYSPESHEATYKIIGKAPYSIILTKSMFIRSDYLFSYTCLLDSKLHETIDSRLNCEDLGFSMMASGISNVAPTYVRPQEPMEDFGLKKGISTNSAHMPARSKCISDFITDYWNEKDPLIKAYDTVVPFSKPVIRVGDWNRAEKNILEN